MAPLKLRNHIPIGSPARREPADGSETAMRVSLGFEPAWFVRRCGVDLGERWHTDPEYRHESLRAMKSALIEAFPEVSYWRADDDTDLATISGVYGAYPIPHLFGIPLIYAPERWPELDPDYRLSRAQIERLDAATVLASPVMSELLRQMETIEQIWGTVHGYLNWQGVINNAFNIYGQQIFMDMYDDPEFVHRFFSLITQVMIEFARAVQARQRESGFAIDQLSVSNCVVNMISPADYAGFVLPYDRLIAESFERFGVHTCNWDITPYIEPLSTLPKLGYLDMGIMSDLPRVRDTFPETRRAVMYSPWKLDDADIAEIESDMEKISRELAPCDIVMADIQADTPDERVRELLSICARLEESPARREGRREEHTDPYTQEHNEMHRERHGG